MRPRGVFADWARKEARAGDRLPYLSLTDAAGEGVLLRDGSVMAALHVPGLPAETAEALAAASETPRMALAPRRALLGVPSRAIMLVSSLI